MELRRQDQSLVSASLHSTAYSFPGRSSASLALPYLSSFASILVDDPDILSSSTQTFDLTFVSYLNYRTLKAHDMRTSRRIITYAEDGYEIYCLLYMFKQA